MKLIASLIVTLLFFWWAFQDADWESQLSVLKSANYAWVVPYFGILTLIHRRAPCAGAACCRGWSGCPLAS
ncbi:hypothetical protein ACN28S_29060 [Cystobacter fuscus]